MIIFNDTEAIEISSLGDMGIVFRTHHIEPQQLPYVQLRRLEGSSIKCEMGYVNNDGNLKEGDIKIGHVTIKEIAVDQELFEDDFIEIVKEYYIDYHYTIRIYLDNDYNKEYIFKSSDRVIYENKKIKTKSNKSIINLFTDIIPQINNTIDMMESKYDINMDFFCHKYSDGGKKYKSYEINPYSISLDDTLDLIYSLKIYKPELDAKALYGELEGKEGVLYNVYIAHLFSKIINADISHKQGNNQNTIYNVKISELPNGLKYDTESLRRYILKKLYIGVILNYEQEKAEEGVSHYGTINDCKDIEQDETIRSILNFILGIKVTCFSDGLYRAGREDKGWLEYTVLFPIEQGYAPPLFLLELINETLGVQLEKQEDNHCYYHRYETEHEYISGLAMRKDCGSYELQRDYLHKILKKVIPMLISKKNINNLLETTGIDVH